ncbi:AP-4 complex accessory subunit Tepsin [Chamberlinius hualienensis]
MEMFKSLTLATAKFKTLKGSLTSSEVSIPGYIYEETVKITFKSRKECREVLEFILSVLNSVSSPVQKLKALKMLKHVAERGDPTFAEMLSKQDRHIKEVAGFSNFTDHVYGNNLSVSVRNEAQELLSLIHSTNRSARPIFSGNEICGMGSTSRLSSGKYDGFGSSQQVTTSMFDRVVSGITEFVDDIRKSGNVSTAEIESQIRRELQLDNGSYNPVKIPYSEDLSHDASFTQTQTEMVTVEESSKTPVVKQRVIGRPGGGWDDDDDSTLAEKHLQLISQLSKVSVEENTEAEDSNVNIAEEKFVKDLLQKKEPFTSWKELDETIIGLKFVNVEKVFILLSNELKCGNDSALRILQVIEAVLHLDYLPVESLHLIVIDSVNAVTENDSTDISCKARKVKLILEKLMAHIQLKQADIEMKR